MEPNLNSLISNRLEEFKARLLSPIILVFSILTIPLLFGSVYRSVVTGWKWIYLIHTIMAIIVWNLYFFRKKISSGYKANTINLILIIIACLGLYNFGILGNGKMFFIVAVIFTGIFIGRKQAYILLGAVLLLIITFAFLYLTKKLQYNFDIENYINQPAVWITSIITLTATILGLQIINNKHIDFFIASDKQIREKQELLAKSEESYRMLVETMNDGLLVLNKQGNFKYVNEALSEMLGYANDTFINSNIENHFDNDNLKIFREQMKLGKKGISNPYEIEWKGNKDKRIISRISPKLILNEKGEFDGSFAVVTDLTESKLSEKNLKLSEERFRTLTSNIPGAVYRCNAEFPWYMEYISDNILEITGHSASEFIDEKIRFGDLILQEDLKDVKIEVSNAILERRPFKLEYRMKHTDGKVRWVMERGQAKYYNRGIPLWLDGIIFDITESKKAQQALQESEERYKRLSKATFEAVVITKEGKITDVNDQIYTIYNYTPEEFKHKEFLKLVHPDDLEMVLYNIRNNIITPYVHRGIKKDGSVLYLEIHADKITINNEDCRLIVIRDITNFKKAEQALQESEEKYRIIAETSPDAVTTTDLIGKINFASQRTIEMHDFSSMNEMIGMDAIDLIADKDRKRALLNLQQTLEKGIMRDAEYIMKKKDGSEFYGELSASVLKNIDNKPIGFLAITKDITDKVINRKKLEERLLLEKILAEFSTKFVNLPVERVYDEINKGFEYIGNTMDFDRILLWEISENLKKVTVNSAWTKAGIQNLPMTLESDTFPNIMASLLTRNVFIFSLDQENAGIAVSEMGYFKKYGIKSSTIIPIYIKEKDIGCISFSYTKFIRKLSDEQIRYLILLGDVLSNALRQRETELALRESKKQFQLLIENIPAVTCVTNRDGIPTYISPNIEKIYGYTSDEIYKEGIKLWSDRIHPEDVEIVKKRFEQLFTEKKPFDLEYRIKRKDGVWIWMHNRANLVREHESIAFAYGVFSDITREKEAAFEILSKHQELQAAEEEIRENLRKLEEINIQLEDKNKRLTQALEKLEENEMKYRTLFENANDGIFIMKNIVFVMCNNKILDMFRVGTSDIIGKVPADFSPEIQPDGISSKSKALDLINKALNDQSQRFEWLHKKSDGELFYAEVSLNKLILGNEIYLQALVRDITEKKQLERKILNAIVETEEKERERFAMELHDGLGPMFSTIKLYIQSVQSENNPEERKSVLKLIHDSIDEAISILREISNNISPHILQHFGLRSAINSFVEKIVLTKKINISFSSNTNERFHEIIEITIYRVIIELINNSLKHARAKNIKIRISQDEKILSVLYDDDGKGMDMNTIADTKSGMGMFNIQNRIKSLNGQIGIESKKNKGLKVHIHLNLDERELFNT